MARPRKSIYDYPAVKQGSEAEKRREAKIKITAADRLTEPPPPPDTPRRIVRINAIFSRIRKYSTSFFLVFPQFTTKSHRNFAASG